MVLRAAADRASRKTREAAASVFAAAPDTTLAEYNAVVAELRRQAPTLDHPEVKRRYQALSMKQGLLFPEPELELIAHLLKDEHWRLRHPGQALGWLWRHRRSASWRVRLRQLATGRVRLAG